MEVKKSANILLLGFVIVILALIIPSVILKIILLLAGMITLIVGSAKFYISSEVSVIGPIAVFIIGLVISLISFLIYSINLFKGFFFTVFIINLVVTIGGAVFTSLIVYKTISALKEKKCADENIVSTCSHDNTDTLNKDNPAQSDVSANDNDEKKVEYNLLDTITYENKLKYEYEKEMFVTEESWQNIPGNLGKVLRFVKEPNNQYDENAVAIYAGQNKLGYVYKGKNQDMINDWIKSDRYLAGYLSRYSLSKKKASYRIGFYDSLLPYPNRIFSLIKTGKKIDEFSKRSDNISMCNEGDAISAELGVESFSYVVYNDMYEEIGELPKSAENFLNEHDFDEIVGTIEEIDYDYDSAPKIKVKIYLLKDWK